MPGVFWMASSASSARAVGLRSWANTSLHPGRKPSGTHAIVPGMSQADHSARAAARAPIKADELTIVPANEASWADLRAIFGTSDYPGKCYCQRFKTLGWLWSQGTPEDRQRQLRDQTNCDDPGAGNTTGLVAYAGGEPVGWVAVEPRTEYPRLMGLPTVWKGRHEDKQDDGVWSVTCFVVRKGYRRRGITYALAAATV